MKLKIIIAVLLGAPCLALAQGEYVLQLPSRAASVAAINLDVPDDANAKEIHCKVSSLVNTPAKVILAFVFFSGSDGGKIISNGTGVVSLDGSAPREIAFKCYDTVNDGNTYQAIGLQFGGNGGKPKSWIVQAYINGKLVAWKASGTSDKITAIAQTTIKLPPL